MTIDMIQEVMEMWSYSSPGLKKALLSVYVELTEKGDAPPWMLFLADEFCLIEIDRSNFYQSHG